MSIHKAGQNFTSIAPTIIIKMLAKIIFVMNYYFIVIEK